MSVRTIKSVGKMTSIIEYEDGRSYDPNAVSKITQQWVDDHMKVREAEFTRSKNASIFCGTWNVNAKKQDGALDDWLLPNKSQNVADVYAVGFQEIVDLNAMNVALDGSKTQQRSQFWQEKITECLASSGFKFTKVMEKHLVGLLLVIFVKDSIFSYVKDVRSSSIGVGIMGMMGNKGGIAIRMSLFDSSVCFICSHLAAHRENVVGRNADFKNIIQRILFLSETSNKEDDEDDDSNYELIVVRPRRGAALTQTLDLTILDHEVVFWMGDLNYRMDENISKEDVFQFIEAKDINSLKKYDQLNIERSAGRVFQGFEEAEINFFPTYKYQPGTDVYETRAEKKLRAPAYCDRILWKTNVNPSSVRCLSYRSSNLLPSDHKPVSALFSVDLREVISDKERAVYHELMQKLEVSKKDDLPVKTEITGLQVELSDVKYELRSTSPLSIKNEGNTLLYWHFIPKLEETKISKRWVSVDINSGLLLPNETADVTVSILIDKKTAQVINQGKDTLDDLLVLRIENCNDYFVSISVSYHRSCYGMSLEELIYTVQPVSTTQLPAIGLQSEPPNYSQMPPKLAIPKELWRLVDALWTGDAIREKDLFASDADSVELAEVRESIDSSKEFPICTPHTIAEAIVTFIAALPSPLLPPKYYPSAEIEASNVKVWSRKFLENLAPLNYTVFVYLISFFREVLAQADYNRSTPSRLAEVCIGCMTPSSIDPDLTKEERDRRTSKQQLLLPVLTHFLTSASL